MAGSRFYAVSSIDRVVNTEYSTKQAICKRKHATSRYLVHTYVPRFSYNSHTNDKVLGIKVGYFLWQAVVRLAARIILWLWEFRPNGVTFKCLTISS